MNALRSGRERMGLSQRELAARAGVAFRTVQLLERGEHDPRWSTLLKIAKILGPSEERLADVLEDCFAATGDSVADASSRIAEEGAGSWRLRRCQRALTPGALPACLLQVPPVWSSGTAGLPLPSATGVDLAAFLLGVRTPSFEGWGEGSGSRTPHPPLSPFGGEGKVGELGGFPRMGLRNARASQRSI